MERVDEREGLGCGALMEVDLLRREPARLSVSGAIGDNDSMRSRQRRYLTNERIDLVTPSAMQHDQRRADADVAIVNRHRRHAGRERRGGKRDDRHETPMLRYVPAVYEEAM